jgi:hypothetical protein
MQSNDQLLQICNGIITPCYLGFWVQYHNRSLEHHKHWFCHDDFCHYVGGTTWKFAIVRPGIATIWPIHESTNLIFKKVATIEE